MIPFGLSYLEDNAEYAVRGGWGNKVLMNIKTENGIVYTKLPEETEWKNTTAHVKETNEEFSNIITQQNEIREELNNQRKKRSNNLFNKILNIFK